MLPECFEGVGIAAALAAESKVFANDQAGQLELLDQHADEVAGVGEREVGRERDGSDAVEPGLEDQ